MFIGSMIQMNNQIISNQEEEKFISSRTFRPSFKVQWVQAIFLTKKTWTNVLIAFVKLFKSSVLHLAGNNINTGGTS